MILRKETYDKFGYYPEDLKPKSDKMIIATCDNCGIIRVVRKNGYKGFYKSCVQRGEKHPNFGKKRSEETKKRISETRKKNKTAVGINNPNWQGGISINRYCILFNHGFKERVREYFGRCCYICGKNEIENKERLSVHHVNYDKDSCCNDIKPLFVPLCRSCHSKTHGDREYWEEFFTISLEYLTDGECYIKKQNNE